MFTHLTVLESAVWLPWLLDIMLKNGILLALAGVVTLACWRASASLRHLIWLLAVIGVLLLPVLSAFLPAGHTVYLPEWKMPSLPSVTPAPIPASPALTATQPEAAETAPTAAMDAPVIPTAPVATRPATHRNHATQAPAVPWYLWLMLIWAAGSFAVLARLLYGYAITRKILKRARPAPAEWSTEEIPAHVHLLLSADIAVPVVVGIIAPAALLPVQAAEWSPECRRAVLLHELAHIRRHDLLAHTLAQLACVCYWMNPLIWLAAYRMRVERETACDNAVLIAEVKASAYAAHLLAVAGAARGQRRAPIAGIAIANSSEVGTRIKGVLAMDKNRKTVTTWAIALTVTAMLLLVVTMAITRRGGGKVVASGSSSSAVQAKVAEVTPIVTPEVLQTSPLFDTPFLNNQLLYGDPVPSPDGRYLAYSYKQAKGGSGIWIGDLQTGKWQKVWDLQGDIEWLPGGKEFIVVTGSEYYYRNNDGAMPHCTFFRVSIDRTMSENVTKLTEITELCDWILIPDGSGIVATRIAERRQKLTKHGEEPEVRRETLVYSFANNKWVTKHLSPFTSYYEGVGSGNVKIRKNNDNWVISLDYYEGEQWINLTTGQNMVVKVNEECRYSPDGQYAIFDQSLYSVRSWPILPKVIESYDEVRINKIHDMPFVQGNLRWAPDGLHIANGADATYPELIVYDINGTKVFKTAGEDFSWVDNSHILAHANSMYVLYDITNGTGKKVISYVEATTP